MKENKCCEICEDYDADDCRFCNNENCPCHLPKEGERGTVCSCACHENKLGHPYEHDTKCCGRMNGFVAPLPENFKDLEAFIEKADWRGLAESFHKGDMVWHAQEWENFIEKIRATQREEVKEMIERISFAGMDGEDAKDYILKKITHLNHPKT